MLRASVKTLALVLCIFEMVPQGRASGIVILARRDRVVTAGDGLVYKSQEKICKIFKVGTAYWAISGYMGGAAGDNYDVAEIVRASYVPGQSVRGMRDEFMRRVEPKLLNLLIRLRPLPQFQWIKKHPLEIAFWQYEGDGFSIADVFYTVHDDNQVRLEAYDKQSLKLAPSQTQLVILGTSDGAKLYAKNDQAEWSAEKADLAALVTRYVSMAIKEVPDAVGKPISVLVVDHLGDHWVKPNECCHGSVMPGPPPSSESKR